VARRYPFIEVFGPNRSNRVVSPVIYYTDEASFFADLTTLDGATQYESFEDAVIWADSRTSISSPGSTSSVTSQGVVWTSNDLQNDIATGTVGGGAPDGAFALFSLPHGSTTHMGRTSARSPVVFELVHIPILSFNDLVTRRGRPPVYT
jgi:hypothetical protein